MYFCQLSKDTVLKVQISEKVLKDLEFTTILDQVAEYSISELGRQKILQIKPIENRADLLEELKATNEYLSSFESDNRIPNHRFDNLYEQIKRLSIDNSYIESKYFLKIASTAETVKELQLFFSKFKDQFPTLFLYSDKIDFHKEIIMEIKKIVSDHGEINDNASVALRKIRRNKNSIQGKIGQSFSVALKEAKSLGYLDDIQESVIDHHRVLAVYAMYRKKIKGSLLGASKSGNIVYVAPQTTLELQTELQNLIFEEKQEIIRILRALSERIRPYVLPLESYLEYLTHLDVIGSKASHANSINALLPKISLQKKIFLRNAYHPILWLKNKEQQLTTIPQTIELNDQRQIIVISGPNAGGKSITLKTVGLLQVMLQSGLLIPVDERSETYIFQNILTDIGDHQSIENQLSTYSYRLKNMRYFLRKCNANTLFLIDEFGTGSDPELGGALAEIFLEEFYHKKAFGIITTHYANLKALANELDNVTNANMQFNERTLEPLFKLYVGQAGSSFTFEVAQKNGIPFSLINKAKKRVETEKIRLDKTIAKLQKERNRLQKISEGLEQQQRKEQERWGSLQAKEQKIREKLEGFQELYDNNRRMLTLGRKINEFLNKYFQTNNKKELTANFLKWATGEKTKYLKRNPSKIKPKKTEVNKNEEKGIEQVEKEVLKKVAEVRKERKAEAKKIAQTKVNYVFKVNDKVRLEDGNAVGIIERIEKKKALINYGIFTTQADVSKLELVEREG